jgi:hypothetical protein
VSLADDMAGRDFIADQLIDIDNSREVGRWADALDLDRDDVRDIYWGDMPRYEGLDIELTEETVDLLDEDTTRELIAAGNIDIEDYDLIRYLADYLDLEETEVYDLYYGYEEAG